MEFAKILARGALGKENAIRELWDCGSSGCGIVVKKKGAEMLDKDPTLQTLLSMSSLEPTQPMI